VGNSVGAIGWRVSPNQNIIPHPSLNPSRKSNHIAPQRKKSRYSDQPLATFPNDVFMTSGSNIRLSDSELRKTVTRFGMTLPRIANANNATTKFSQERERVDQVCFSGKYARLNLFSVNAIMMSSKIMCERWRTVLNVSNKQERLNSSSSIVY